MPHQVYCIKLQKNAEGLARAPMPGTLGERVYQSVSKEAWQLWLKHQTILINEHRLRLSEVKDRQFLTQEMEKYFFQDGIALPESYTPK